MPGSRAAVGWPGSTERWTYQAPLSVSTVCNWSTSTPQEPAKPVSARVGFPSASRPAATAGPRRSVARSGWRAATSGTYTARRRGEQYARAASVSAAIPCFSRPSQMPRANTADNSSSALGGNSSVPNSISSGCTSDMGRLLVAQAGKAEFFALRHVRLRHGARQGAHAQNVALALGDADGATRVQQVERVAGLHDLLVGRQRQAGLDQLAGLGLAGVEPCEQGLDVGVLEVVGALLDLVLVEHVAVGDRTVRGVGPDQVVDVVHVLQVHGQALQAVGDFARDRPALQAAGLL